ncbi:MAG: tail fiber domain-containing protein [Verrucomicrobia bacterium]|nr:tail fiber domain-containing protein [Verrucomicrobiota bacterium]
MKIPLLSACALLLLAPLSLPAGAPPVVVPPILHYQGRVAVDGVNFDGQGQFKFALVNFAGTATYWSHDGSSTGGAAPATAITLPVQKGLYAVLLGDFSVPGMTSPVPLTAFNRNDVRLRVWFNDGTHGFQLLTPDQRLGSSAFAMLAGNVADGAVTSGKIADGSIQSRHLEEGAINSASLAPGTLAMPILASVDGTALAPNRSYSADLSTRANYQLPPSANPGDLVQITGTGTGGWQVGGVWTPRDVARSWTSLAFSQDGRRAVATAFNWFIFTSGDGGATWTQRDATRPWTRCASSADGQRLAAVLASATPSAVFTSTDAGVTWTANPCGTAGRFTGIASSADGLRLLASSNAAGLGDFLYTSIDGGQTWTTRLNDAPRQWQAVASSADGLKLSAADYGGRIYTSTDGGVSWIAREADRQWNCLASSADGLKLVAGVNSGQLYVSSDAGVTWTARESSRVWTGVSVSARGDKILATALNSNIFLSRDAGVSWAAQESSRAWRNAAISGTGERLAAVGSSIPIYVQTLDLEGGQGSAVTLQYLGDGVWEPVRQTQLAPGAVTATQLAAGAVTNASIASGTIGANELANGAVTNAKLATGSVSTLQIADGSVTNPKLAAGAVSTTQLAGNSVTTAKIAPGAVTGSSIAGNTIVSANLTNDLSLPGIPRALAFVTDPTGLNDGTALLPGLILGNPGSGEGIASRRTNGTGQFGLSLYTDNAIRLHISNDGNVGIGTNNPTKAKLQIVGSVSTSLTYGYLNGSGNTGTAGPGNVPLSLHASDRVAASEFNAFSDARIKRVVGPSDSAADLRTLRQIEVTDYTFKDRLARGDTPQKKVLAQQVEQVFPQAVSRVTDVVPDIFLRGTLGAGGWIELPTDLRVGERVRLVAAAEQGVYEVLEVRPGAFRTAFTAAAPEVFVYGREVADFRTVDYDGIAMLNVSATQELARRLEAREAEVADLRQRLARLERLLLPPATAAAKARPVRNGR